MTTTKQFIEDAIEGGYKGYERFEQMDDVVVYDLAISVVLLDPLAWQAVGKTRGWAMPYKTQTGRWEYESGMFFQSMMSGLSIEEALLTISE